jgi:hypothetical protein
MPVVGVLMVFSLAFGTSAAGVFTVTPTAQPSRGLFELHAVQPDTFLAAARPAFFLVAPAVAGRRVRGERPTVERPETRTAGWSAPRGEA